MVWLCEPGRSRPLAAFSSNVKIDAETDPFTFQPKAESMTTLHARSRLVSHCGYRFLVSFNITTELCG